MNPDNVRATFGANTDATKQPILQRSAGTTQEGKQEAGWDMEGADRKSTWTRIAR